MQNTSLPRRAGAMLYDGLLIVAVLFLGTIPFVAVRAGESVDPGSLPYQLAMATLVFVFYVGFWSRYGRTLGMQSWGLRIEDQLRQSARPREVQRSLCGRTAIVGPGRTRLLLATCRPRRVDLARPPVRNAPTALPAETLTDASQRRNRYREQGQGRNPAG